MKVKKQFQPMTDEQMCTRVFDDVSATIPDQSISLREMMMKFAYIGSERLEEIVNRGFDGDEDEDILGVDVGALDFSEVHDRMVEMQANSSRRVVHAPQPKPEPESVEPEPVKTESTEPTE